MKSMYLLALLFFCVYLVKVESAEIDSGAAVPDNTVGTDEQSGSDTAPDESALNERAACSIREHCEHAGGICKKLCSVQNEIEIANGCYGRGCMCCAPHPQTCRKTTACWQANGVCQQTKCSTSQQEIPSGCHGTNCYCCAPPTIARYDQLDQVLVPGIENVHTVPLNRCPTWQTDDDKNEADHENISINIPNFCRLHHVSSRRKGQEKPNFKKGELHRDEEAPE
nr:uncharacterized protein LOC128699490 [Cherax quadricarinatus]